MQYIIIPAIISNKDSGGSDFIYKDYLELNKSFINLIENINMEDQKEFKRGIGYLEWIKTQNELFIKESSDLIIPDTIFKNKINLFEYNKHINILKNYYYKDKTSDAYIKKNLPIADNDKKHLLRHMILIKGSVVWIEFGFNVGCEFGGKHPAVILRNVAGRGLIVAPISSGVADTTSGTQINISKVYNFSNTRDRYTDINRITPVSIYRVDLKSEIGKLSNKNVKEINSTIINNSQKIFSITL